MRPSDPRHPLNLIDQIPERRRAGRVVVHANRLPRWTLVRDQHDVVLFVFPPGTPDLEPHRSACRLSVKYRKAVLVVGEPKDWPAARVHVVEAGASACARCGAELPAHAWPEGELVASEEAPRGQRIWRWTPLRTGEAWPPNATRCAGPMLIRTSGPDPLPCTQHSDRVHP